jgi:hypothetical protein
MAPFPVLCIPVEYTETYHVKCHFKEYVGKSLQQNTSMRHSYIHPADERKEIRVENAPGDPQTGPEG